MHTFEVSVFDFSDVKQWVVFPYSEFRDETVQGIDTQIECITGDGFGDWEAQIVQRDIPVAINGSVGAQAKDVF